VFAKDKHSTLLCQRFHVVETQLYDTNTLACTVKLFADVLYAELLYASVLVTHYHPCLTFADKARSLTFRVEPLIVADSSLAHKY
jgi:hypothetical protein